MKAVYALQVAGVIARIDAAARAVYVMKQAVNPIPARAGAAGPFTARQMRRGQVMATATNIIDDPIEMLYERGVTDGLPVVPPTRDRVDRMLGGAPWRRRDELIGMLGPMNGNATVEKVAINAVMAGCKPEYFPVVLAGVEGLCDKRLCAHGLSVTLMSGAPLAIINGPVRGKIGLNCGHNALGHGFRANATIGRALRLVTMNIGGARPHGVTKATMGHPGQYSFLVAENEEVSPWEPFHTERGFKKEDSVITLFGGTGCFQIADFASNTAERLVSTIGGTMGGGINSYRDYPLMSDTVLVLSPEHAKTIARDGWSRRDVSRYLYENIVRRPEQPAAARPTGRAAKWTTEDGAVRKFRSPDAIMVVVAGGTAGRLSVVIPGWVSEELDASAPVSKLIRLE
jgi:hypothetical protein